MLREYLNHSPYTAPTLSPTLWLSIPEKRAQRSAQRLSETPEGRPVVAAIGALGSNLILEDKEWLDALPIMALAANTYKRPVIHIMPAPNDPVPVIEVY